MAELLGGELVEGKRQTADRIVVRHGAWRIITDVHIQSDGETTTVHTRVRAYFPGWRGLRVLVRRRNFLDRIWEALGFATPLPLKPSLLERYVVKGSPSARVPSLFAGQELYEAIESARSLRLQVKRPGWWSRRTVGQDAGVVVVRTNGVVRDLGRLGGLIRTVACTLDALHRVGEARAESVPEP
jgi:hypothetical protein